VITCTAAVQPDRKYHTCSKIVPHTCMLCDDSQLPAQSSACKCNVPSWHCQQLKTNDGHTFTSNMAAAQTAWAQNRLSSFAMGLGSKSAVGNCKACKLYHMNSGSAIKLPRDVSPALLALLPAFLLCKSRETSIICLPTCLREQWNRK